MIKSQYTHGSEGDLFHLGLPSFWGSVDCRWQQISQSRRSILLFAQYLPSYPREGSSKDDICLFYKHGGAFAKQLII
jgi:hypothetical protein